MDALHRLEAVFVETIKNVCDDKDKIQKETYLKEIENLKMQNERLESEYKHEMTAHKKK